LRVEYVRSIRGYQNRASHLFTDYLQRKLGFEAQGNNSPRHALVQQLSLALLQLLSHSQGVLDPSALSPLLCGLVWRQVSKDKLQFQVGVGVQNL
jgi:hypothetical protein